MNNIFNIIFQLSTNGMIYQGAMGVEGGGGKSKQGYKGKFLNNGRAV